MFASGPLLASIVFSAAARLAPLLWPQLSVLLLLCVLSLGVSATVWAWVQRQELGVSIRENSPGPNALPPTRVLKRKPSSFRAGGSNARLDDLEALNPAGRAAKVNQPSRTNAPYPCVVTSIEALSLTFTFGFYLSGCRGNLRSHHRNCQYRPSLPARRTSLRMYSIFCCHCVYMHIS
jgi:hypothetical protein